ncbi:MAG TPA: secretin N-terminal domain-containing protein [Bryobacteraceae bacterium]|nr:secretin N-terminal domain-containing protein [Bryobacteraceae bacterium]
MQRIVFALAFAGGLVAQQTQPPPPETRPPEPPHQQRVFLLKYADARNIANVLGVFGYGIKADRDLHVVAVSAPAEVMTAIDEAVKRLDVPAAAPKDVDLVVYMVVASDQPSAGSGLPSELQAVGDELKKIFAYKSFRLLDSVVLRTQPGNRAEANGVVVVPNNVGERPYHFSVIPSAVTDDLKGRLIRLDQLHMNVSLPGSHEVGIQTEITLREGQQVVVGKSNMGTDQALVLVVTAKVVE